MRLFFLAILVILLAGLILFGLGDTVISIAGTSIPAQTPNTNGIRLPSQHGAFYAEGRYWLFYYDTDEEISFKSSTDGESWSSATKIGDAALYGATFDVVFDGTYVHYIRNLDYLGGNDYLGIAYRRGIPQSDGSINWSAAEQTVLEDTEVANDMQLAVDSDGYAWIGYGGSDTPLYGYPTIIKSATSDGTWSTASGFPYTFFETDDWIVIPVSQTFGQVYCIVYRTHTSTEVIKGYQWDGDSWGSEEEATTSLLKNGSGNGYFGMLSAVAIEDDIHLAFTATSGGLKHVKRTSGSWGSESTIEGTLLGWDTSPVLTRRTNGDLVCCWLYCNGSHTIEKSYYKEYSEGTWDITATELTDEYDDKFVRLGSLQSYYEEMEWRFSLIYQVYDSGAYDIVHVIIDF